MSDTASNGAECPEAYAWVTNHSLKETACK